MGLQFPHKVIDKLTTVNLFWTLRGRDSILLIITLEGTVKFILY